MLVLGTLGRHQNRRIIIVNIRRDKCCLTVTTPHNITSVVDDGPDGPDPGPENKTRKKDCDEDERMIPDIKLLDDLFIISSRSRLVLTTVCRYT